MNMNPGYVGAANELRDRIIALIPEHPEILEMTDPFDLHDVEGFTTEGLSVSFFQASWALAAAKEDHAKRST